MPANPENVRATISLRLLHRAVAHRLDLVAIRIAQERAVVGGVIVAQAAMPARQNASTSLRDFALKHQCRLEASSGPAVDGDVDTIRMLRVGPFTVTEPPEVAVTVHFTPVP